MTTIHPYTHDGDLEARIADVVATTTSLVEVIRPHAATVSKKKQLRQAFARLAELKAQRHPSVIRKLDFENGLGYLP